MARTWIGTAGWSYPDWERIVYPDERSPGFHPLPYLARFMDIVEINSTFYRPATSAMVLSWVRRVAAFPDFLFSVKLHQSFTHERRTLDAAAVDGFRRALEPLVAARRLAALLLQFPWSFAKTEANRAYLAGLLERFDDFPKAVEFRQSSWDDERTYDLLREKRAAFCNIDQPRIGKSLGPSSVVTNPAFTYIRLHGRNTAQWFKEGAGRDARYDYLYAKDELGEWVRRIKDMASSSERIYVITNNHYRGQALANALQLKNMTTGKKVEVPENLLRQYPLLAEIVRKIRSGQRNLFDDGPGGASGPEKE